MCEKHYARWRRRNAAPRPAILTHEEVLVILSKQAKAGSVTAAAALERALRAIEKKKEDDPVGDAIAQILGES
jgi:hypothetical protein